MSDNELTTVIEPEEDHLHEHHNELPVIPRELPVLPLRDVVVFPNVIIPLFVARRQSVIAVDKALDKDRMILLVSQKDDSVDEPTWDDLYHTGTVAIIMKMMKLPDDRIRIIAHGVSRAKVTKTLSGTRYMRAEIEVLQEQEFGQPSLQDQAMLRTVRDSLEKCSKLGRNIDMEVVQFAYSAEDGGRLADLSASNLDLKIPEAQDILEAYEPRVRLEKVNKLLAHEVTLLEMQARINSQVKGEIDKTQREYVLRQQLKAIQSELGEGGELAEEIAAMRKTAETIGLTAEAAKEVERHIKRLERMQPESAEAATIRTYLEWMLEMPWKKRTEDNLEVKSASTILDKDHYGLEKIKDRILEYLSVRKLNPEKKGPILCFIGPPGTGKTSLGRSIAHALGRKFVRLSLGGVHDEAEIRGHRKTYVGAMPGRIMQALHNVGTRNPVFMLDEVDKIGADFRGDPSAALLEVLDPEQNHSFRDHYLGVAFDLSNVMFITTGNLIEPIEPAFRDRMEILRLNGYTTEEKLAIAKRHLLPKILKDTGLKRTQARINAGAIRGVIGSYTREAGLRNLERELATIFRKIARGVAEGKRKAVTVTADSLEKYLGPPRIFNDSMMKTDRVGVATGLAWTPTGGDVLFVEVACVPGTGKIIVTGKLGEVMRESSSAALTFARSRASKFKIDDEFFSKNDVHVHVPEGAIPKDGPSAGVTMAAAMLSAFTGRPIRRNFAMTGEITLRGEVLPVGGVKDKALAARRAGIKQIILPELNRKDLTEIPKTLKSNMKFHFVEEVDQLLSLVIRSAETRSKSTGSRTRKPAR